MQFVVYFIFLLAVNIVIRTVFKRYGSSIKWMKKIGTFLPWIELVIWTLFIIWFVNTEVFNQRIKQIINIIVIAIVLVAFLWFFLRDFIAGLLIKTRYKMAEDDEIRVHGTKGKITKLGTLSLELFSEAGSELKIPYAQIDQRTLELNLSTIGGKQNRLVIELRKSLSEMDTISQIEEMISNSPWCSPKFKAEVSVIDQNEKMKSYEVTYRSNGLNAGKKIKEMIEQHFK